SPMVRPMTNWWPMIRIAWRTARRTTGSPTRPTRRLNAPGTSWRVMSLRLTRRPVSISPQVEALTSTDSLWPRCFSQSASPSLSRISLSAVSWSGMRSSASATHISSTPSSLPRSYWRMKASIAPWWAARARTRRTRSVARASTSAWRAGSRRACSSSSRTWVVSSRSQAAVMAARRGEAVPGGSSWQGTVRADMGRLGTGRPEGRRASASSPPGVAAGLIDSPGADAGGGTNAARAGRVPSLVHRRADGVNAGVACLSGSARAQAPVLARGHAHQGHEAPGEGALVGEAAGLGNGGDAAGSVQAVHRRLDPHPGQQLQRRELEHLLEGALELGLGEAGDVQQVLHPDVLGVVPVHVHQGLAQGAVVRLQALA